MRTCLLVFSVLVAAFMLVGCQPSGDDMGRTRMDEIIRFRVANKDFAGSVFVAKGGIELQQDGEEHRAKRVVEPAEVTLPVEKLLRYAGIYQIAPGVDVVMTVEDGRLMAKPPSDPKQELFAETENKFFFSTFNAQVEFTRNKAGQTTGLIFRNAGNESRAIRR